MKNFFCQIIDRVTKKTLKEYTLDLSDCKGENEWDLLYFAKHRAADAYQKDFPDYRNTGTWYADAMPLDE